jgi:hypothetical protein
MPPGWYPHPSGQTLWWDGIAWTQHAAPQPAPQYMGSPVPVQPNVRQSRDRSQYTRQQKGHSIVKHLLLGWVLAWIPTIYYAISPNHYFHL